MLVIYATVKAQTLKEIEWHLNSHATSSLFLVKMVKNRLSRYKTCRKSTVKAMKKTNERSSQEDMGI